MTDHDETPLERDLRRVLADPGYRLPDRLVPLDRVHAGAVRRRRRHQAVTASLAALAVVGIGLGVARPWSTGNDNHNGQIAASNSLTSPTSPSPTPSKPSPSEISSSPAVSTSPTSGDTPLTKEKQAQILADPGTATAVTAINDRQWWVSFIKGNSSSLAYTSDDGSTFSVVAWDFDTGFAGTELTSVRFVDGKHGTALLGSGPNGRLATLGEGGRTRTEIATAASFLALEAGGGKTTWALQLNADSKVHLWRQVASGSWVDVATLPNSPTIGAQNVQLTVQQDRAIVVWRDRVKVYSASFDTSGMATGPTVISGCAASLGLHTLSGGRGAIWLTCPVGNSDRVFRSTDDGNFWTPVSVPGTSGRHTIGAIDTKSAVVSTDSGLAVLDTSGGLTTSQLPAGVNTSGWSYIGFTGPTHGFALTDTGRLLRSTDGGLTWTLVTYTR